MLGDAVEGSRELAAASKRVARAGAVISREEREQAQAALLAATERVYQPVTDEGVGPGRADSSAAAGEEEGGGLLETVFTVFTEMRTSGVAISF